MSGVCACYIFDAFLRLLSCELTLLLAEFYFKSSLAFLNALFLKVLEMRKIRIVVLWQRFLHITFCIILLRVSESSMCP